MAAIGEANGGHSCLPVIREIFVVALWKALAFSLNDLAGTSGFMTGAGRMPDDSSKAMASSSHVVPL